MVPVAVFFLIVGLVLLQAAREGLREGDTPHCTKCDYNLTGLTSQRCPECGTELKPQMIALGKRRGLPVARFLGLLFTLGSLFFLGKGLYDSVRRDRFWFRIYPANLLFHLFQSPDQRTSGAALTELDRRLQAGSFSAAQTSQAIDLVLKALPTITVDPTTNWVSFNWPVPGPILEPLTTAVARGQTSYSQADKYLSHWILADLQVRSRIRQGDTVPYSVCPRDLMSGWGNIGVVCRIDTINIFLDGTLVKTYPVNEDAPWRLPTTEGSLLCDHPGRHTLRATFHSTFYLRKGKHSLEISETPCHTSDIAFDEVFDVLPSPADPIRPVPNASLQTQMHSIVQFKSLSYADGVILGDVSLQQPPASVALDIIVLIQGKEYGGGAAAISHDNRWWSQPWHNGKPSKRFEIAAECPRPANDKCDIILRSNPDRARETVDIYEMWDGELVFKDVPIEQRK